MIPFVVSRNNEIIVGRNGAKNKSDSINIAKYIENNVSQTQTSVISGYLSKSRIYDAAQPMSKVVNMPSSPAPRSIRIHGSKENAYNDDDDEFLLLLLFLLLKTSLVVRLVVVILEFITSQID
tara:strand:+ start:1592 stop:1960 length:369 start_codon:yes stop_codon:yes gene_type:complete